MLVFPSRHRTIIRLSERLPLSYSYTDRSGSETQCLLLSFSPVRAALYQSLSFLNCMKTNTHGI